MYEIAKGDSILVPLTTKTLFLLMAPSEAEQFRHFQSFDSDILKYSSGARLEQLGWKFTEQTEHVIFSASIGNRHPVRPHAMDDILSA